MNPRTIVVLATLDTKGKEAQYLRECIEKRGHRALVMDTGVTGTPAAAADIARAEVAAAGGMAEVDLPVEHRDRPLVGVTTVGITTVGAMKAAEVLENAGFETIVFHAVGTGGRAMEEMMRQGIISAVLDFSIIEVSNEMHGALLAGGPERLTTAGRLGLPQVICPGAVEVLVFNEPHTVPEKFRGRTLVRHSPKITDVRLDRAEMAALGREVARRLGETRGDAVFLIPAGG